MFYPSRTVTFIRARNLFCLFGLLLFAFTTQTVSAKPMTLEHLNSLRTDAPEALRVHVTSVKYLKYTPESNYRFVVTARVLFVDRSSLGIRPGQVVKVTFWSFAPGTVSCAAPAPLLQPGWKGRLYCRIADYPPFEGVYTNGIPILCPAALSKSYEPTGRSRRRFMIESPTADQLKQQLRLFGTIDLPP